MRAMTYRDRKIQISEVPVPEPGPGQLLVRTLACGICASDHHYVDHPEVNAADKSGMRVDAPDRDVIMGHEFCAEIVDYGPDCQRSLPIGTRVTSIPALIGADSMRIVGYAPDSPGGYGEYFVLTEFMARAVPDDIPVEHIAVNDAIAVGWYYSRIGMQHVVDRGTAHLGLPSQVVYECAGVKGVLTDIIENCAAGAHILSAGGSHVDEIPSAVAHLKGLNIQWGGGPEFDDWYGCLDMIVEGRLDPRPFIGETITLDALPDAFERARSSSSPLRIIWKADHV